ncbi:Acyl-coenzyme A thioesterase 9, mitochondrial [Allomyces javanicus]|nr:Acyl-coenzyme A thioesterase 9, mitochondrial [Allomyces javanicus]
MSSRFLSSASRQLASTVLQRNAATKPLPRVSMPSRWSRVLSAPVNARPSSSSAAAVAETVSADEVEEIDIDGPIRPGTRQHSVLPHRTSLTARLWVDRFDRNNADYQQQLAKSSSTPAAPRQLVLKRMSDSYVSELLPFKSNAHVREEYITFAGGIRIAKVLEDLDAMAGSIAYTHCASGDSDTTPPITIVTASVDRLDLLKRPTVNQDCMISGKTTYVGNSSLEVTVRVDGLNATGEPEDPIVKARFTMVARDPITNRAVQVNPLVLENDEERRLFSMGADLRAKKKIAASTSLNKAPPTSEERLIIHDLWQQSRKFSESGTSLADNNTVWMADTKLSSSHITQPQDRNIHGFVFGGFLMRQAFDIAYSCASLFSQAHPMFLAMDDIWFRKPVPIGCILQFQAQVVYSRAPISNSFQVQVTADVVDPLTGKRDTTNVFHYTFTAAKTAPKPVPHVLPRTYAESMLYLDAKRRWETGFEMAKEGHSLVLDEW